MFKNKINYQLIASMLVMGLLFNYTFATTAYKFRPDTSNDWSTFFKSFTVKIYVLCYMFVYNIYEGIRSILIYFTRLNVLIYLLLVAGILKNSYELYYNEEFKQDKTNELNQIVESSTETSQFAAKTMCLLMTPEVSISPKNTQNARAKRLIGAVEKEGYTAKFNVDVTDLNTKLDVLADLLRDAEQARDEAQLELDNIDKTYADLKRQCLIRLACYASAVILKILISVGPLKYFSRSAQASVNIFFIGSNDRGHAFTPAHMDWSTLKDYLGNSQQLGPNLSMQQDLQDFVDQLQTEKITALQQIIQEADQPRSGRRGQKF